MGLSRDWTEVPPDLAGSSLGEDVAESLEGASKVSVGPWIILLLGEWLYEVAVALLILPVVDADEAVELLLAQLLLRLLVSGGVVIETGALMRGRGPDADALAISSLLV